jgi:hypothetical protein
MQTEYLTRLDLANRWRVSYSTIRNLEAAQKTPAPLRVGRQVRFLLAAVQQFEQRLVGENQSNPGVE